MSDVQTSLTTIYQGWDAYQGHLLKTISPLTEEQLTLRVAPQQRSAYDILAHIIAVRARWFYELGDAGEEVVPFLNWDRPDQPARSVADFIHGLEVTWQMLQNNLSRWTIADLPHTYTEIYQGKEYTYSRQWVIWHVLEHDLNHGGELFMTLGTHGLETPDL